MDTTKKVKKPTFLAAISVMVIVVAILMGSLLWLDIDIRVALMFAIIVASSYAMYLGFKWDDIQKMSIHDGPGIRTTVFFKGCPLRCLWCSNPESQRVEKEIAHFQTRCVKCGYCAHACPKGIIEEEPPFDIKDRSQCDLCEVCVEECCTGAKKIVGEDYTADDLLHEILKDKSFYDSSGGGVTFSGGGL